MKEYKQTTLYTSGVACLLMVLNHFNPRKFELTKDNEFRLWQRTATLPTRGASVFAMAVMASENNIPCRVIAGNARYTFPLYRFYRLSKAEINDADYTTQIFRSDAEKKGIKIEIRDFNLDEVKKLLEKGKKLVLRLNYGFLLGTHPRINYYLLDEYKSGKKQGFVVYDPFNGKRFIDEKIMQEAFEGVLTKCKRDHRMVIFG